MNTKQVILKLDPRTHRDFKTKCTTNGETMTNILKIMISHYVDNSELGLITERVIVDKFIYTTEGKIKIPSEFINLLGNTELLVMFKLRKKDGVTTFTNNNRFFVSYSDRLREITSIDVKSVLTHGKTYIRHLEGKIK